MTRFERATQVWAVLALAAKNRQTITYYMLSRLIGVPTNGLGQLLEPVQSYCIVNNLPPITLLVVQKETGLPGEGFTGAKAEEFARSQMSIFAEDWLKIGNPNPQALEEATIEHPSNG